ncbi:MAG TPA: type II secretion system protein GspN [Vicinamibacterales bacterium]|nr:type II secretion system protein GspN [Vicinamibacterales bacterium]
MKRIGIALLVLAVFVAGTIATFPALRLAHALVARLPPDTARAVERIDSAHLGFGGLTLEDVTLRPRPNAPPIVVRTLSLRPSLLGIVRGRQGRPWHVRAHGCAGRLTATLDDRAGTDVVSVAFEDLDLVACLAPLQRRDVIEGRAAGEATLLVQPGARTWNGVLRLAGARWQAPGVPRHLALRADDATVRWRLDDVLHIDELALTNEDFSASGTGLVRFPAAPGALELDLRIRVQPTAAMPQANRDLFARLPGSPPEAGGARTFRIRGPLDAPQIGPP